MGTIAGKNAGTSAGTCTGTYAVGVSGLSPHDSHPTGGTLAEAHLQNRKNAHVRSPHHHYLLMFWSWLGFGEKIYGL
jgi:hypothetical protein